MPLLVNSVPNLAQGVSQQPDNLRYPGQCDEQVNAWATVVEGLVKRPNTRHISKLFTSKVSPNAHVQIIDRDETNRFVSVIDNNDLSVFDLNDGSEKTVTITADAQTYLNNISNPREDVKALTVADYTFIANKEQTVSLGSSVSPALSYEALVFVKLGDYDKQYAVHTIFPGADGEFDTGDDVEQSFDVLSGDGVGGDGSDADTIVIATQLYDILNAGGTADYVASATVTHAGNNYDPTNPPAVTFSGGGGSGATAIAAVSAGGNVTAIIITNGGSNYSSAPTITIANPPSGGNIAQATAVLGTVAAFNGTVVREDAVIKFTATEDFRIHTNDGLADQGLGLVYKEVSNITDLPAKAFNDFRVKVKGDTELVQDDYYVKFQTKDGSDFGEGTWIEDIGYGVKVSINATTMPLQLKPDDVTFESWTLDTTTWGNRTAGDDDTNPAPTFVGSKINDIFFFKNRLGLLTDNSIVFSEADEYFNFWRTTVLSLLDSAPIDVGVSHTKVAILKHAVPFQEKLLIFSEGTQFVLRGQELLTPKTVSITPATEYDASGRIKPIVLNNYVYFPFKRNTYTGLTEYYIDNDTAIFDAAEITAQVPTYVKSDVIVMAGTAVENVLAVVNNQNRKEIFIYKYFWQNKEKIQSAWQKFTLNRDVVGLDFIESDLYILTNDTTSTYLEVLPMENDLQDDNGYTLLLDSRIDGSTLTTSYSSGTTTISGFPYDPTGVDIYTKNGHRVAFTRTSATAGTVSGALASYVSYSGSIYKCIDTHTSSDSETPDTSSKWSVSTDFTTATAWAVGKKYNDDNYFVAGFPYDMLYRFSDQTLKQPTERGGRSASDYTYQTIRSGSLNYADTGHFIVEVTPKFRDTYTYAFNPDILGSNLTLNSFTPQDGHFKFSVQGQPEDTTIEVKSSSALPVKLLAAEFESMFIPRSKRYGS